MGMLAGATAPASASAQAAYVAEHEAETFTIQGDAIRGPDGSASGSSVLLLGGQGSSGSRTVALPQDAGAVVLRARSHLCDGGATGVVSVDGKDVGSVNVPTAHYQTYTVRTAIAAGTHTVAIRLVDDHYVPGSCDRNLIVDTVAFAAVPPTSALISQDKPVTATTQPLPARNAVDGNMATRWSSDWADPQSIVVDLEGYHAITRVKLHWEGAFGRSYQVQVSTDARNWRTIRSVSDGDGGLDDFSGLSSRARFVRIRGTTRGTAWGYSLWELQVFGHAVPLPSLHGPKKGVGVTAYWAEPRKLTALGAGWAYNWHRSGVAEASGLQYVPMVWGPEGVRKDPNDPDPAKRPKPGDCYSSPLRISDAVVEELKAGRRAGTYDTLLAFNEPDVVHESCLSPQQAIDLWPRLMETGLRLGAPAPGWANSGWIDQFMDMALARGYRVDFVPLHFYQDFTSPAAAQQVIDMATRVAAKYRKPLWITEAGAVDLRAWGQQIHGTPTHERADEYMRELLRFFERSPFIERYAWFSDNCWTGWPECRYGSLYDDGHALTLHGRTYADPRSGWTASASHAATDPNDALDGKPGTRWSTGTAQAPGQWFQVDMAGQKVLDEVTLDAGPSAGDQPRGYVVRLSPDGANWTEVGRGQATGQSFTVRFAARSGRYVQVRLTGTAANWWSIHEMTFN